MKKLITLLSILGAPVFYLAAQSSFDGINYQCVVRKSDGNPSINENLTLTFSITRGNDPGFIVYSESHETKSNESGIVNLIIGKGAPIANNFSFFDIDWSGGPHFLSIDLVQSGNRIPLGTTQLLAVPYALFAQKAKEAPGDNWGTQAVQVEADGPLSGNGQSDNPLHIKPKSITGSMIADGAIGNVQLQAGLIPSTLPPSGAAGGDLGGTYPNPLVQSIQGMPVSSALPQVNQILQWNGSQWAPMSLSLGYTQGEGIIITDNNISSALGNSIESSEITNKTIMGEDLNQMGASNGQVLKWSGTQWVPATDNTQVYSAGTGITLNGTTIINTGDTNPSDDVTNSSVAGGDINGTFSNLQLNSSVVGSNEITNGSIQAADIAPGVIPSSLPPSGGAGGDLNGFYPSPTVRAIQGRPISSAFPGLNQVLKWNGSQWTPGDVTGGSFNNCGSSNTLVTSNQVRIGDNSCPTSQFDVITQNGMGALIEAGPNDGSQNNVNGLQIKARNGSMSNDGVIIFAYGGNNRNTGLKVVPSSSQNTPTVPSTNEGQNIGVLIDLKNNNSNNSNNHNNRDIGLYVKNQSDSDYAAYFDGDVAIPREIEFIDINNSSSHNNGRRWALFISKTNSISGNLNDFVFSYQGSNESDDSPRSAIRTTGEFLSISDKRKKENISMVSTILSQVLKLNPSKYNFIFDETKTQTLGFIAQEVQKIFPELVHTISNENGEEFLGLHYDGFSVIAIKAIQEQQEIINAQKATIAEQEARLSQLEKEMANVKDWIKNQMADSGSKK